MPKSEGGANLLELISAEPPRNLSEPELFEFLCVQASESTLAAQGLTAKIIPKVGVVSPNPRYSVNGITADIPSSGIFRVVGGGLALGLCFIEKSSEY
jgi:hypothetical protein